MRSRRVLPAVAVLSLMGAVGCGDDPGEPAAAPAPAVSGAAPPAVGGSMTASPPPLPPGGPGPAGGATADPATAAPGAPGTTPGTGATPAPGATGAGEPGGQAPPRKPVQPGTGAPQERPGFAADTLSAGGLGPYLQGTPQQRLRSSDLLGAASTDDCPGYVVAKGLSRFQTPTLIFHQGRLQYLRVNSATVATSAGARVGMSAADVKARHPGGRQLDDWVGATAWFAPTGDDALLFRFSGGRVTSIEAGLAEPIQFRFTDGQGC